MNVDFGWEIPSGDRRMPRDIADYQAYVRRVLSKITGCFHSAWLPDHFMNQAQDNFPEALITLSHLAGLYPDLLFGPVVLGQNYRNPALLAKMAATMQLLSGDRFILGIGAGWKADEYGAYGYNFPSAPVRIALLAETVQICKLLWDPARAKASFQGIYYRIDDAACYPKPASPPPVMIGGAGEKLMLRVVATHADWWNLVGVSPEVYAHKLEVLSAHCASLGRDPAGIRKTWLGVASVAATHQQAEATLEEYPIWPGDVPIVGEPAAVIDQLHEYTALGVDLFILGFADEPNQAGLDLFMTEVIPAFK